MEHYLHQFGISRAELTLTTATADGMVVVRLKNFLGLGWEKEYYEHKRGVSAE